jgi:hypothetical protein
MKPDNPEILFSLIVMVLFFGGIFGLWYYPRKKRVKAFEKIAGRIDVKFIKDGTQLILAELKNFYSFNLAGNTPQYISNLLQGTHEGSLVSIFDYKYSDGFYVNQQSAIYFRNETDLFLEFSLLPKDLSEKLDKKCNQLDRYQVFSRPWLPVGYRLLGPKGNDMRALMDRQFLSYLEANEDFCVEGSETQLLFYRFCKVVHPDKLPQFMDQGIRIMRLIAKNKA